MPPPAQPTQLPGQQLSARENGQFKKLVVCSSFFFFFTHRYFIICYLTAFL
jgi:hypothetical protein